MTIINENANHKKLGNTKWNKTLKYNSNRTKSFLYIINKCYGSYKLHALPRSYMRYRELGTVIKKL